VASQDEYTKICIFCQERFIGEKPYTGEPVLAVNNPNPAAGAEEGFFIIEQSRSI
jgi:hypothetical protein